MKRECINNFTVEQVYRKGIKLILNDIESKISEGCTELNAELMQESLRSLLGTGRMKANLEKARIEAKTKKR